MPKQKDPAMLLNIFVQMILPAIAFIGSAAILHNQVSDLSILTKETTKELKKVSERFIIVETKVQMLYDDRKKVGQ